MYVQVLSKCSEFLLRIQVPTLSNFLLCELHAKEKKDLLLITMRIRSWCHALFMRSGHFPANRLYCKMTKKGLFHSWKLYTSCLLHDWMYSRKRIIFCQISAKGVQMQGFTVQQKKIPAFNVFNSILLSIPASVYTETIVFLHVEQSNFLSPSTIKY